MKIKQNKCTQLHATDLQGRLSLGLALLPEMVQFQICGTGSITGLAGIPSHVLSFEQLPGCRKGRGGDVPYKRVMRLNC